MTSEFYMGSIVIYLGINSWMEMGVSFAFMFIVGLFSAVNATIASCMALPKVCKSGFDITSEKEEDSYKGLISIE